MFIFGLFYHFDSKFYDYDFTKISLTYFPERKEIRKIRRCFVAQSCTTLWDPMDCSTPGFPVHHQLKELTQTHVHQVGDAIQPSHPRSPLLLPHSTSPSISVFSNESVLPIRWPKYWSFSFSISPSNEYPGLISFRMDWLDLLAVQGLSLLMAAIYCAAMYTCTW